MMRIQTALLFSVLLASGCTPWLKRPESTPTPAAAAPAQPLPVETAAPAPKLLPHDDLSPNNAKEQAKVLEDILQKENQ